MSKCYALHHKVTI